MQGDTFVAAEVSLRFHFLLLVVQWPCREPDHEMLIECVCLFMSAGGMMLA